MDQGINRRVFLGASSMGTICMSSLMQPARLSAIEAMPPLQAGKSKVRIGKVYIGQTHPGWPVAVMDLNAEKQRFEAEFAKMEPALEDIEFVGGDLVSSMEELQPVIEKFKEKDVCGILILHLSMGIGSHIDTLLKLQKPIMVFAIPYAGHEWHTIAAHQKRGDKIDIHPSSDFNDIAVAVRPFRAIGRLKEAKILYVNVNPPDAKYTEMIEKKFGTKILHIDCPRMIQMYESIDPKAAAEEAEWWTKNAEKIVEPTPDDIFKSGRMFLAMKKLIDEEQADTITINCLGLFNNGLPDAYPCFGFSKLSGMGLGGICEADLKSSMTHLIYLYLTGKPGYVSDPIIDLSNNTIIHAHCVSPLKMDGVNGEACPFIIRSHLENNQGASLFVRMKVGQKMCMTRLIGDNLMLYSNGEIVDTPYVERGCRTKITTKVKDAQKIMENWSCGLHRVIFYGDPIQDLKRFCRFKDIRIVREDEENVMDIPGLEWEAYVHA